MIVGHPAVASHSQPPIGQTATQRRYTAWLSESNAPEGRKGVTFCDMWNQRAGAQPGQQTGSKRPKTASLSHAESKRKRAEKPHE